MKRYLKISLISTLLIFGLFLRLNNLEARTGFVADQEWLAYRAREVIKGDFPLLGPVTSVGNFSIGPGYVYLCTIFSLFSGGNPVSGAYLSVLLGILTCLAIFLFAKYFINEKVAFILLFLTVISSSFIFWDQNPWTPSLFYLAQTILLCGAYQSLKNKWGYPIIAIGFVVGFQSHLGIVLSLISIFIYFIFVKPIKPNLKVIIISLSILMLGLLPNIVFDLTHNFVNLKRLLMIVKGDGQDYFVSFGKIINILSYNVVSILYPKRINLFDSIFIKSVFALILVNGLKLLRNKKEMKLSLLLLITIIIPSLFFYIQQGKFSEYYLMMTVPSLILLLGLSFKAIINKNTLIVAILLISTMLNIKSWLTLDRKWSLKAKRKVIEYIINKSGKENYGISLTTKYGEQFGFSYLFDYYGVKADIPPKKGETKIFTIVIPEGFDGITGMTDIDGIGLIWQGM